MVATRFLERLVFDTASAGTATAAQSDLERAVLRGWATHIQRATSGFAITETELHDANLGSAELAGLQLIVGEHAPELWLPKTVDR
jgi:hypothetical protein